MVREPVDDMKNQGCSRRMKQYESTGQKGRFFENRISVSTKWEMVRAEVRKNSLKSKKIEVESRPLRGGVD